MRGTRLEHDTADEGDPTLQALRGVLRALRVYQAIRSGAAHRRMRVVELITVELLSDAPYAPN